MCRVGLCASLHIVGLQIVDINALVIEHTIEPIYGELLIDTIDGSLDVLLATIEVILVDRADRGLLQVGAAAECQCRSQYVVKIMLSHNLYFFTFITFYLILQRDVEPYEDGLGGRISAIVHTLIQGAGLVDTITVCLRVIA